MLTLFLLAIYLARRQAQVCWTIASEHYKSGIGIVDTDQMKRKGRKRRMCRKWKYAPRASWITGRPIAGTVWTTRPNGGLGWIN